ncbi:MAG: metallophosphoesterase family protein [Clostridia bacterium]|nr:metallophosphoesterase family protein [Clostridia bacterium]
MRIGFLSDLHRDRWYLADPADLLAEIAHEKRLDYLVLSGDTAPGADAALDFCRRLDAAMPAKLRIVAGNHDIYVPDIKGRTPAQIRAESAAFYTRITYESDYSLLLHPIVTPRWFITGLGGWYDYSFAPGYPQVDLDRISRARAARWFWSDNRRVRGGCFDYRIDVARVEEDIRTLRAVLTSSAAAGRRKCAVTHMLPTRALAHSIPLPGYGGILPLLGSERYRDLYEELGVSLCICGHTHFPLRRRIGEVCYANVSLPPLPLRRHPFSPKREMMRIMLILEG